MIIDHVTHAGEGSYVILYDACSCAELCRRRVFLKSSVHGIHARGSTSRGHFELLLWGQRSIAALSYGEREWYVGIEVLFPFGKNNCVLIPYAANGVPFVAGNLPIAVRSKQ